MPDGEDTSWLCPVTEGRVAKMPGGEAAGTWVIWGWRLSTG